MYDIPNLHSLRCNPYKEHRRLLQLLSLLFSEPCHKLSDKRYIISSDAHYLTDIRDKEAFITLDDEPYSSALVRKRLIQWLKGG